MNRGAPTDFGRRQMFARFFSARPEGGAGAAGGGRPGSSAVDAAAAYASDLRAFGPEVLAVTAHGAGVAPGQADYAGVAHALAATTKARDDGRR